MERQSKDVEAGHIPYEDLLPIRERTTESDDSDVGPKEEVHEYSKMRDEDLGFAVIMEEVSWMLFLNDITCFPLRDLEKVNLGMLNFNAAEKGTLLTHFRRSVSKGHVADIDTVSMGSVSGIAQAIKRNFIGEVTPEEFYETVLTQDWLLGTSRHSSSFSRKSDADTVVRVDELRGIVFRSLDKLQFWCALKLLRFKCLTNIWPSYVVFPPEHDFLYSSDYIMVDTQFWKELKSKGHVPTHDIERFWSFRPQIHGIFLQFFHVLASLSRCRHESKSSVSSGDYGGFVMDSVERGLSITEWCDTLVASDSRSQLVLNQMVNVDIPRSMRLMGMRRVSEAFQMVVRTLIKCPKTGKLQKVGVSKWPYQTRFIRASRKEERSYEGSYERGWFVWLMKVNPLSVLLKYMFRSSYRDLFCKISNLVYFGIANEWEARPEVVHIESNLLIRLMICSISEGRNSTLLECLLDRKAHVSLSDESGNTCLHIATKFEKQDVSRLLIARGASMHSVNLQHETPALNLAMSVTIPGKRVLEIGKFFPSLYEDVSNFGWTHRMIMDSDFDWEANGFNDYEPRVERLKVIDRKLTQRYQRAASSSSSQASHASATQTILFDPRKFDHPYPYPKTGWDHSVGDRGVPFSIKYGKSRNDKTMYRKLESPDEAEEEVVVSSVSNSSSLTLKSSNFKRKRLENLFGGFVQAFYSASEIKELMNRETLTQRCTPFLLACEGHKIDIKLLQILMKLGCDIHATYGICLPETLISGYGNDNMNCLFAPAFTGQSKVLDFLLSHGVNANHECKKTKATALHMSILRDSALCVSTILKHGGSVTASTRYLAEPRLDVFKAMSYPYRTTGLVCAMVNNISELISHQVSNFLDGHASEKNCLILASDYYAYRSVNIILNEPNVELNKRLGIFGYTAVHMCKDPPTLAALLGRSADVNIVDTFDRNPMDYLTNFGYFQFSDQWDLREMILRECDINAQHRSWYLGMAPQEALELEATSVLFRRCAMDAITKEPIQHSFGDLREREEQNIII